MIALYAQLNPDDPAPDPEVAARAWAVMLARDGLTVFVAEDDTTLVATCTLVVVPNLTRNARPYALIENVVTDTGHRTQGLGRAVIEAALARAWADGCYKAMLMTGSKRPETLRFYVGLGFEQSKTGFQMRKPV